MMAAAKPKPALRPFLPADAPLLAEIFRASIAELTGDDYSEAQQEAWVATADDAGAFAARLAGALRRRPHRPRSPPRPPAAPRYSRRR